MTQASYKKSAIARPKKRTELTEEQRQEIKEAFDLFDTDGSGREVMMQGRSMRRSSRLRCGHLGLSLRRRRSAR